jgi:uncharacterized protein YjbI with pentapeptide repeats
MIVNKYPENFPVMSADTPTPPVPALGFQGRYKISIPLTGYGTQYIKTPGGNSVTLSQGDDDNAVITIYRTQDGAYVLQGANYAQEQQAGSQLYIRLNDIRLPNNGGEFTSASTVGIGVATRMTFELAGAAARFFVAGANGYLQARGEGSVTFWLPPKGSLWDQVTWNVAVMVDTAASDWKRKDFRWVEFSDTMMLMRDASFAGFQWATIRGAWWLSNTFDSALFDQADLTGAYFSAIPLFGGGLSPSRFGSASFKNSKLAVAQFQGCPMKKADFTGATFSSTTSFAGADLTEAIFGAANLAGIDFTDAILARADLTGATLTGATLSGADLSGTKLGGANLTDAKLGASSKQPTKAIGANLAGATLLRTDFTSANLTNADLHGAAITDTVFTGATMIGTNFSGCNTTVAKFDAAPMFAPASMTGVTPSDANPRTRLIGATLNLTLINLNWNWLDLTGATINGTLAMDVTGMKAVWAIFPDAYDLTGREITSCDFSFATMKNVKLPGAFGDETVAAPKFNGTDLTNASMTNVQLRLADFSNATLQGAKLGRSTLHGAIMAGAKLQSDPGRSIVAADLSYCGMQDVDLSGAQLTETNLQYVYLWGAAKVAKATMVKTRFDNAYLTGLDFQNVGGKTLEGASFAGACLVAAKFQGTALTNVSLAGACLQGANFSNASLFGATLTNAAVARAAGTIKIRMAGGLPPIDLPYDVTVIATGATNSDTSCPDAARGPCSGTQWDSPNAPMREWPKTP